MDVAITLVMLVPVLLVVALIIGVIRRNITERQAGDPVDISGAIPAVIVLMVAVLIIVAMGNAASPYVWDEDSGELTIQKNVPELNVQPWDSYASEVRSLVIEDGVTIGTGAFDSLTGLEYVSIGGDVTLGSSAFGVSFLGPTGTAVADLVGYEYAGFGDGTLYQADPAIFTYGSNGKTITGLASEASGTTSIVIPRSSGTATVTEVAQAAFQGNTVIERILTLPGHAVEIRNNAVRECSALTEAHFGDETNIYAIFWASAIESTNIPAKMSAISNNTFWNCTGLTAIELPASIETIGQAAFRGCTSLTDVTLNEGLKTISSQAFYGCTAIESIALPASVETIGGTAFRDCSGVTSVSFASGFAAELADGWCPWTFFESDGTTQIDKSLAANLAGKSFQGVYNALVEVAPGQLALTPQQLQQVQLHTQELQQQELDVQPLPFQPSLQTQDQESVSA